MTDILTLLSTDGWYTVLVILVAVILFVRETVPVDVVAIGIMVMLVVLGVISVEQSVAGFSNPATLTVAAMFVLSRALIRTRVLEAIGPWLKQLLRKGYVKTVGAMSLSVAGISAFVNNTPVVATFIPIISDALRRANLSPSRYLIPLSYAAIFGGTCTLIGTSTNLLVSGIASENGAEPFSMFLMVPLGLVFFVVGTIYLVLAGPYLLPKDYAGVTFKDESAINDYMTEVQVGNYGEEGPLTIGDIFLREGTAVHVKLLRRHGQVFEKPADDMEVQEYDTLVVQGSMDKIKKIVQHDQLHIGDEKPYRAFPEEATYLIEVVILRNSTLANKKLKQVDFLQKHQARVLAVRQKGEEHFNELESRKLYAGDILLLQTTQRGYELIQESQNQQETPFISMRTFTMGGIDRKQLLLTSLTIGSVVLLASLGILPILTAALGGIVVLYVGGVINMRNAYDAIDWQVIFLLAGALSLEKAMTSSGLTDLISSFLMQTIGEQYGPVAVISMLYLTTSFCTEIMSNNAAAAMLTPIALSLAGSLGVNTTPLLLAIAFAGSASFMTPVGYQTNTMVYSAGSYQFKDFLRIGAPLNLIFWLLASWLIPVFYAL